MMQVKQGSNTNRMKHFPLKRTRFMIVDPLRIIGPCYRGVWICMMSIAGVWDLQTTSFEIS